MRYESSCFSFSCVRVFCLLRSLSATLTQLLFNSLLREEGQERQSGVGALKEESKEPSLIGKYEIYDCDSYLRLALPPILANLAISLVNYLSTFLALYLVDKAGRRLLLVVGGVGMAVFTGTWVEERGREAGKLGKDACVPFWQADRQARRNESSYFYPRSPFFLFVYPFPLLPT